MIVGPLENYPDTQEYNIRGQMEKIMKNETQTHLNNADKWKRQSLAVPFSSNHVVYLTSAPAPAAPSNFSNLLSLRQVGRSQIIHRMFSHFKVKQQPSTQLFHCGIFRPYAGELEIEQSYRLDRPHTSSPIYLDNYCTDHLGNTSACKQPAVP